MLHDNVIAVSGVGPGLGLEVARLCLRDGARVAIGSRRPLKKMPYDEDVAEAVVFFLSDRARMITGQTLRVGAGERMGWGRA